MTRLDLSIKSPCSEKWESFEKNGDTGYCPSCRKNVIDFTKYSDQQIIEYFKNNKGDTCGRLRKDQVKVYKDKRSYHKIAAVLTAGVLTLSQSPDAFAQTKAVLKGRVFEENDTLGLPGTNVVIKNSANGVVTDGDGNYELRYSGSQKEVTLMFSFIGFVTYEKVISLHEGLINIEPVMLQVDETALAEEIIVGGICARRGLWSRITSIFRK